MSFPTDFPKSGVSTLMKVFSDDKPSTDLSSLAAYDVVGYVLYRVFGDVKYPMQGLPQLSPEFMKKIEAILASPEFAELVKNFPQYALILGDYAQMKASGTANWVIFIQLAFKYGPSAISMIRKLVTLWNNS